MEEHRMKLMKTVFPKSLMMLGFLPIILIYILPRGFGAFSHNYLQILAAIDVWYLISPAFLWIGVYFHCRFVEDKNSKIVAIWFAIVSQMIWIFGLLFRFLMVDF